MKDQMLHTNGRNQIRVCLLLSIVLLIVEGFSVQSSTHQRSNFQLRSSEVDENDGGQSTSVNFAMEPDSDEASAIMDRFELSADQQKKMRDLSRLVVEWNDRVNLVSRKDCSQSVVFGRHILPCLGYLGFPNEQVIDEKVRRVVDVGTGGGFPGLPLAIAYPDIDFLLVDSIGKKLSAVENMAERLGLSNVKIHHGRAEDLVEENGSFNVCVGRSVAAIPKYCFWVQHLIAKDGKLAYMIGGDIEEDILALATEDEEIDALLDHPGASDKRMLVFPRTSVVRLAKASGEVARVQKKPRKDRTDAQKNKKKIAKGAWAKRDPSTPKQRGYENFKRYDSSTAEYW